MSLDTYTEPVAKLLTFGDCNKMDLKNWVDYVEQVGLSNADVPELIRMATDMYLWELEGEGLDIWAPIHAWRSLGQLHAEAAIDPLIQLFKLEDNDWVGVELPQVFALIGTAAIAPIAAFLTDPSTKEWEGMYAADSLKMLADTYPDNGQACIDGIVKRLESFSQDEDGLNGGLINNLVDLKVVEAAPLMEKVFAAEAVDEFFTGTWATVQVDLGLKAESDFSEEELKVKIPPHIAQIREMLDRMDKSTPAEPQGFGKAVVAAPKPAKKKKKKK
jgi:Protein of unknown function (DUF1186)